MVLFSRFFVGGKEGEREGMISGAAALGLGGALSVAAAVRCASIIDVVVQRLPSFHRLPRMIQGLRVRAVLFLHPICKSLHFPIEFEKTC